MKFSTTFLLSISIFQLVIFNVVTGYQHKPCHRKCDGIPKTCEYFFEVENYYSMRKSVCGKCPDVQTDCFREECIIAGGVQRMMYAVNRQFPGPKIEVCHGDEIVVTLLNEMSTQEMTTIHWHGQTLKNYPYMDGVPFVTQCPILSQRSLTYRFTAAISGTHWWHSHEKMQRGDGFYGMLIVRQPENTTTSLYDEDLSEHEISIVDWTISPRSADLIALKIDNTPPKIDTILINGLGFMNCNAPDTRFPIARFTVESGKRYRFRFANVAFYNCPVAVQFENHKVTIIAADGNEVKPKVVKYFNVYAGERYDVVLNARKKTGTFWIRFKGLEMCANSRIHQVALLQYLNSGEEWPVNPLPSFDECLPRLYSAQSNETKTAKQVKQEVRAYYRQGALVERLQSATPMDEELKTFEVVRKFIKVSMPMHQKPSTYRRSNIVSKPTISFMLNDIAGKDTLIPILQYRDRFTDSDFCNEESLAKTINCSREYCHCPHVIKLPLNEIIELVVYDDGKNNAHHPIHLHGHQFYPVARQRVGQNLTRQIIEEMDWRGMIDRNFENPVKRDVTVIPKGGFVILRFKADNPGYWFFHCHVDIHANAGMRLTFKVGENWDMPNPPLDFPCCETIEEL